MNPTIGSDAIHDYQIDNARRHNGYIFRVINETPIFFFVFLPFTFAYPEVPIIVFNMMERVIYRSNAMKDFSIRYACLNSQLCNKGADVGKSYHMGVHEICPTGGNLFEWKITYRDRAYKLLDAFLMLGFLLNVPIYMDEL